MIGQVLSHTPAWVFAPFLGLLAFGLMQTRTRTVRRIPALLLPAVMNALNAAVIAATLFVVGLSAVYGALSGYFSARALNLIRLTQKVPFFA